MQYDRLQTVETKLDAANLCFMHRQAILEMTDESVTLKSVKLYSLSPVHTVAEK